MKKLILLLLLIIPITLFSQRFKGGVMGGFNVSQIDGDTWGGYSKAGLMGGAFVFTEFPNEWGGQLEIRYSSKGSATAKNNPLKRKIRLQYIELPLLATYNFSRKFRLQGGISLGYLYEAAQNDDNFGYEPFDQFDNYEIAACIGGNYFPLDNLSVNARLSYSILPTYARYPGATTLDAMYNNVITFGFYYWFAR